MIFYDAVLRKNALGCLADRMAIVDADIAPDGVGQAKHIGGILDS